MIWHDGAHQIITCSDSDWAGDKESLRSISEGVICRGAQAIRTWAKQQSVIATSSCEAELNAATKAAQEGLGIQSYAADLSI